MPGTYTVTYTGTCEECGGTGELTELPSCRHCGRQYEHKEVDAVFEEGRGKAYPLTLPCGHPESALNDGIQPCDECEGQRIILRQVPLAEALAALGLVVAAGD